MKKVIEYLDRNGSLIFDLFLDVIIFLVFYVSVSADNTESEFWLPMILVVPLTIYGLIDFIIKFRKLK